MMRCTSIHFRTPNNVPPSISVNFELRRWMGILTEGHPSEPRHFDDGTWEVRFYALSESELTRHRDHVREGCSVLARYGYEIVSETDCSPQVSDLIENLCKRPDMYTGHDTFDSVMDYLQGFCSGVAWCEEAPEATQEAVREWDDFIWVWLRERSSSYHYPHAGLRAASSDDKAALENLVALWAEYRATKPR